VIPSCRLNSFSIPITRYACRTAFVFVLIAAAFPVFATAMSMEASKSTEAESVLVEEAVGCGLTSSRSEDRRWLAQGVGIRTDRSDHVHARALSDTERRNRQATPQIRFRRHRWPNGDRAPMLI
jgi:hypothetical protein